MKLFHLGIKDDLDSYTNHKKKVTNQVAMLSAFTGLVYSFFIYAHYPSLLVFPLMCFITSCGLLVLNYYGFFRTARFLVSFEMLLFTSMFHASVLPSSDLVLLPLFSSMVAMVLFPWALYGLKEVGGLVTSFAICLVILLIQPLLNQKLEFLNMDTTFFRESYLSITTYVFAAAILALLVYMIKNTKNKDLEPSLT